VARDIDSLTSFTLKHLRDRWWDAAFTEFLRDVLQPQPRERILDVGCGAGTAELILTLLQGSDAGGAENGVTHFVGIDVVKSRLRDARRAAREHALRSELAVADAVSLPFAARSFDGAFGVAVLQHVERPERVIVELARVLRPGGRVVLVEPDNAARYWFSEPTSGHEAFELATRFFSALDEAYGEAGAPTLGPRLPGLLRNAGFQALAVHLFPVSVTRLGAPVARAWNERQKMIQSAIERAPQESLARLGRDLLHAVNRYAEQATAAGPAFVEIQNTMLFAAVAQRDV
jgi:ubiquinone/menaquinone biosynthesis C-methylase UbiE